MAKPLSPDKRQAWKERITEQNASGLSIEHWCREHHLCAHQFHYWKKRLFPPSPQFTELKDHKSCLIQIEYDQIQIQLKAPTLKQGLLVLREFRC